VLPGPPEGFEACDCLGVLLPLVAPADVSADRVLEPREEVVKTQYRRTPYRSLAAWSDAVSHEA
jgi:hypothetical protein